MSWALALVVALAGAWLAYGPIGRSEIGRPVARPAVALALGALRGAAYLCLLAILLGAPLGRSAPPPPLGVLDVSESWERAAGSAYFLAARDTLRQLVDDSVVLAGDSARVVTDVERLESPRDTRSMLRAGVDLAQSLQRPLILVTDGELDDPALAAALPPGSQVIVPPRPSGVDVAVASFDAPLLVTGGDTVALDVELVAGNAPVATGRVVITANNESRSVVPLTPFDPYTSRRVAVRLPIARGTGTVELAAIVVADGDIEPRNDTLRRTLDVSDRPRAVFVSTAPDLDVREALRVLRGTVAIPTRAYLRVATGVWREEGSLAPIAEAEVERRARAAGLLILHGDTTWAGLASTRLGPSVLWSATPPPPPARAGVMAAAEEWFVTPVPPSPLASLLEALPVDSLPPPALPPGPVANTAPTETPLLAVRLGRRGDTRPLATVAGDGAQRRVRVVGSGFATWVQRGGRAADAFSAFWGAIFDWAAAAEGAIGGVRVAREPVRAGEPVRWRRGTDDSLVVVRLAASSTTASSAPDSLVLRFGADGATVSTVGLPEGRYRATVGDATFPLVVNPSREWIPRAPRLTSADSSVSAAPRARGPMRPWRESAWPFVLALGFMCAEWLARRAVGLR